MNTEVGFSWVFYLPGICQTSMLLHDWTWEEAAEKAGALQARMSGSLRYYKSLATHFWTLSRRQIQHEDI